MPKVPVSNDKKRPDYEIIFSSKSISHTISRCGNEITLYIGDFDDSQDGSSSAIHDLSAHLMSLRPIALGKEKKPSVWLNLVVLISSHGGRVSQGMSIVHAINANKHFKGYHAHITYNAMSMGAYLFFNASTRSMDRNAYTLVHTIQYGSGGVSGVVADHTSFMSKQIKKHMEYIYSGFLTKKQLKKTFHGKEYIFDYEHCKKAGWLIDSAAGTMPRSSKDV